MSIVNVVPTTIPNLITGGTPVPTIQGGSSGSVIQGGGSTVFTSSSPGLSLTTLVSVFVELFAVLVVLSLVGVFVIIVVANRADPDPSGRRPQSVYYFAVSFVTLAVAILGSAVVVSGVVVLVGSHANSVTNSAARAIVFGALATLVGVALFVPHLRRGLALAAADRHTQSPSQRVGQSYVSAVAFVSVLSLLVLFVFSAYLVFALAGPGVFGSFGGRSDTVRVLIVALYLWVVAAVVLWTHRTLVTPELHILGAGARPEPPGPEGGAGA